MKRLWWIAQAAWYLRSMTKDWTPSGLLFCWDTADNCWLSLTEGGDEPGCPYEAIEEEVSCWTE